MQDAKTSLMRQTNGSHNILLSLTGVALSELFAKTSFARNIISVSQPIVREQLAEYGTAPRSDPPASGVCFHVEAKFRRSWRLCSAHIDLLASRLPQAIPISNYAAVENQASVVQTQNRTERLNLTMITHSHAAL